MTTQITDDVDREHAPKTATRVTVNLSRKSVEALDTAGDLTDDSKTDIINKALQLYREVQEAQHQGGGVWLQADNEREPVKIRFY